MTTESEADLAELIEHVEHALRLWCSGTLVRAEHELLLEADRDGEVNARIDLGELAAIARYDFREWENRVGELTWISLEAARLGSPDRSAYEGRRPLLRSMLVPIGGMLSHVVFGRPDGAELVEREVATGLFEIVTLAIGPFGPRPAYRSELQSWGVPVEEVFAHCRENLDGDYARCYRTIVEQGLQFFDFDDDFPTRTAATLALRPDVIYPEDMPELGPLGAFLAVPEINVLRVHPIRTSASLDAPALLSDFATQRYEGAENELSPLVYHWRDGNLQALHMLRSTGGRMRLSGKHEQLAAEIAALPDVI
jgi:hypothetical protein